jgi:8-oxo-dGTP pyrophosphatase MutT (NUDIX family)
MASKEGQGELFVSTGSEGPTSARAKKGGARAAGTTHKKKGHRAPGARERREFSAGFILYRDTAGGRVYLLLDYGKHWDYPKGHLEEGETAWQAAVRELREETGIRQVDRVTRFERDMHYTFYSPKKGRIVKTVTYFVGRTRMEKVEVSDEHSGYAWLGYEDAMQRLTYDNAREMLRAAHEAIDNGRRR